jgi:hypothetical protein
VHIGFSQKTYLYVIVIISSTSKANVWVEKLDKNGSYSPTKSKMKFRVDTCKILGSSTVIQNPFIKLLLRLARKFGKLPYACPIKKVY